jgi:hypothetical protein
MKALNRKQFALLGFVAITLAAALTSCDKQEIAPASLNPGGNSRQQVAQATAPGEEIKSVVLKPEELNQIREIFSGFNPSLYRLEIEEDEKAPVRLGSAAIADLQKTGTYYSRDFTSESRIKVSKIITKIVTKIVVKKFLEDENNVKHLAQVESILNTAAAR